MLPSPEEDDVRLVAGTERAEEMLVRLRTNLDGVGDNEGRLLLCPLSEKKTLASSAVELINESSIRYDAWLLTKEKN